MCLGGSSIGTGVKFASYHTSADKLRSYRSEKLMFNIFASDRVYAETIVKKHCIKRAKESTPSVQVEITATCIQQALLNGSRCTRLQIDRIV